MRLYRLPSFGGVDDLTLAEAPAPRPARGQVLVRMRAASLNYRDLMVARGGYGSPPGLIPMSDGAGEVVEVGPDVTRLRRGDRVAPIFVQSWIGGDIEEADNATTLGGAIDGVLAEQRVFEQDAVVRLPDHLSFEEGATLPCAALTAWNALYEERPLKAGQTVLVLGTGGVSVFALQFAHAAGARTIVTSSSAAKLEKARELGAAETIDYRAEPDWEKAVLRLTGGLGVDHVIEVGGAGTLPRSIACTRFSGSIHLIGVLTGGQIDPAPLVRRGVTLRGVRIGSRQMFEAMNRMIAFHRLRPAVDRVFPFEAAKDAYRHLQSQAHFGKVVIRIG